VSVVGARNDYGARSGAILPLLALITALALPSCDAFSGLIETRWEPAETNGQDGVFHFVKDEYASIGYPQHVRVERIETRAHKKGEGTSDLDRRERKVRVVLARCESRSICDAVPWDKDPREIIVTPKIMGATTMYVTAILDEKEELKDAVTVKVR
jgi:hypothetical protein